MRPLSESASNAVLEVEHLTKRFDGVAAVDDVSFSARPGEILGLLGPNGAGKTTSLLMILGAIEPTAGTIEISGERLPKHRSRAMSRVGFAAGYLPLPDRLKVGEALRVFAGWYGVRHEKQVAQNRHLFIGAIDCQISGRHGFAIRVVPGHPDLASPFEPGLIYWS